MKDVQISEQRWEPETCTLLLGMIIDPRVQLDSMGPLRVTKIVNENGKTVMETNAGAGGSRLRNIGTLRGRVGGLFAAVGQLGRRMSVACEQELYLAAETATAEVADVEKNVKDRR